MAYELIAGAGALLIIAGIAFTGWHLRHYNSYEQICFIAAAVERVAFRVQMAAHKIRLRALERIGEPPCQ
jgi:hypothetical protein